MKPSMPLRRRPMAMALAVGALVAVATPIAALELTARSADTTREASARSFAPVASVDAVQASDAVAPFAVAEFEVAAVAPTAPVASADDWYAGQDAWTPPPPPPPPPAAPPAAPAPPAPPAAWGHAMPPAPPAPPRPPAPPAHARRGAGWVHSGRPLTAEQRQAMAEAHQAAAEARLEARDARHQAVEARAHARARVAAAPEARVHARAAVVAGERASARAAAAQQHAAREMANARVHMAQGADHMVAGAARMREESTRLRDPAYRATQIERARERGETVTDAELEALAPRLATQAGELERRAVELRERAERQPS